MPLRVIKRRDSGTLQITGWVRCLNGKTIAIRRSPSSQNLATAQAEASTLERHLIFGGEPPLLTGLSERVFSSSYAYPASFMGEPQAVRLTQCLEKIALLALGGAGNLKQIAKLADEALELLGRVQSLEDDDVA